MSFRANAHGTGIVHIGPGAFHRAHQAVYTQDAMAAAGGDWRIYALSPRSRDVARALAEQKGRYTLVTRGASGSEYRVIEAISDAAAAIDAEEDAIAMLARPEIRVVSLTVTEKAYRADARVIELITKALALRYSAGRAPFTLMSCDNLSRNGAVLRKVVLDAAGIQGAGLADWLSEQGRFPSTMVDRITPAATPSLLAEIVEKTGFADQVPVETEAFTQWVIEDDFVEDRPAWEAAGAQLVRDVAPFERMKLRMLNGAHSMLAYAGHLTGNAYVRDVMADPGLSAQVARHMRAAAATLEAHEGIDTSAYQDALILRFQNPHIAHETYQIAMDGSQKMPQRIFAPALDAALAGQDLSAFATATALWARYLTGRTETGVRYALRDPREGELSALPANPEDRINALWALPDLVPPALAAQSGFRALTQTVLRHITERGVDAALKENAHA